MKRLFIASNRLPVSIIMGNGECQINSEGRSTIYDLDEFSEKAQRECQDHPFVMDEIVVKRGNPVEAIINTSQEQDCDIIVMGYEKKTTKKEFPK